MNGFSQAIQALTPAAGVWSIVGLLILTLIKGWPKLKQIQASSDDSLRHDLLEEIARLRADIVLARAEAAAERVQCDAKIAAIGVKHDAEMAGLKAQMQQMVESIGRSANAPTTIGQTIARAYPIPIDMQEQVAKLDGEDGK